MDINDIIQFLPKVEIPDEFKDFDGNNFKHCIECDKELIDSQEPYLIEKALKPADVIFEYAICFDCAEKFQDEISEESKMVLFEFYEKFREPFELRMSEEQEELGLGIERCILSNERTEDLHEYQIFGLFIGDKMVRGPYPYALSAQVLSELQDKLSKKTRDMLDGFGDRNFDWPPELKDLLNPTPVII